MHVRYYRSYSSRRTLVQATITLCIGATFAACSTTRYREKADAEVYEILEQKSAAVPGMTQEVDIEPPEPPSLEGLPVNEELVEFLGDDAEREVGAAILTLEQALRIAFTQSREYQTQLEALYLEALSLTLDRHEFAPIFFGAAAGEFESSGTAVSVGGFTRSVDAMAGSVGDLVAEYQGLVEQSGALARGVGPSGGEDSPVDRDTTASASTSVGVNMLFQGGARLAVNLTSSFLGFIAGSSGNDFTRSSLSATFTQPLLRGAGRDVTTEFLTQAERDVLYQLRDFTRFRKEFVVRVASSYYGVLQNRATARNNYNGLKSFELSLERERAFQREGLRTAADVGRLEQSKLSRDATWTRSVLRYEQSLDNFKILLGYSTDAPIVLDETELDVLVERGIRVPQITEQDAVQVALVTRLDLETDRDIVYDAERRIKVAANALKADLDVILTGDVDTGEDGLADFNFETSDWTAGFALDLPFDRKAERNSYRRSLIDFEVAKRNASLASDRVKLEVRDAYRNLEQAQKDYEINASSVVLNEARVEEELLRAELGLGNIIDQVDAQNDLTEAQSALSGALVAYQIALLEFWRDMGILYVKDDGRWEELKNV